MLDAAATPLLSAISDRGAWLRILDDLNARLPKEDIWITELAPTSGGKIRWRNGAGRGQRPRLQLNADEPRAGGRRAVPMIDGVFVRGLYLSNPKQQEIVVDYFRNLLGSTIFEVDAEQAIGSDQTEHADEHGVGLSLRVAAETAPALRTAMNWFQQNDSSAPSSARSASPRC